MKNSLLSICILFVFNFSYSQTKVKDTTSRKATIIYDKKGNVVNYKTETPTLLQIAGAPKAYYTFFWEFGDGTYSKEATPKKTYKKPGEYKTNVSVTNNYDNGKPPKTRPKIVAVNEIIDTNFDQIAALPDTTSIQIFKNREPIPEEEIVVAITYQNPLDYMANGKIYLFYNDKEFKNDNFELIETRTHFGESEVFEDGLACADEFNNSSSSVASTEENITILSNQKLEDQNLDLTLLDSKAKFRNFKVFEFDGMNAKETRNMFFTFQTTPQMIKDTSATVKMRTVFVPDRNYKNHKKKTLEMEIVTSHDPNKMSSNATFMNYRTVRFKTINFKTQFQNDGEGPARMIRLETEIPDMFDKKTLKIVDSYPKCPICPKDEVVTYSCLDTIIKQKQIHFTFKNIYIPGSNQKNVTERDSTKGFVKYTMKFAKDFHKVKTRSKTAIFFDKNEPVITNYALTRFKPGVSVGVRTGYNLYTDQENPKSYFLGATISPYKSYRFYWQAEINYNYFESNSSTRVGPNFTQFNPLLVLSNGTIVDAGFIETSTSSSIIRNSADIVPISLRYNINNFIGVGIGPQFSVLLNEKYQLSEETKYYFADFNQNPPTISNEITEKSESSTIYTNKKAFENIQTSFFADVTFGIARIGPSVGIRYYVSFENNFNYWQFYGIWKF